MDTGKIFLDGAVLSVLASILIVDSLRYNPRLFLQDYPENIQRLVPPKTKKEKQQTLIVGIPFLILLGIVPFLSTLSLMHQGSGDTTFLQLFINAFGVVLLFNLVDLVVLDWLMFCTLTPKFVVIPGTEGAQDYKDYWYHLKASVIGTILSILAGLVIAGIVFVL